MEKPILLPASSNTNSANESKPTITLTEIADSVDSRAVQLATKKRRIRKIIKSNNIPYEDTTKNGWLISEVDAEKIKSIYVKEWKTLAENGDPIEAENKKLKHELAKKNKNIDELQKTIDHLNASNNKLQKTNDEREAFLRERFANEQELQARQQELTHNAMSVSSLQAELSDSKSQVIEKQDALLQKNESLNEKDREIAELRLQKEKLMSRGLFARLFNKKIK